jgi:hypothetical protein
MKVAVRLYHIRLSRFPQSIIRILSMSINLRFLISILSPSDRVIIDFPIRVPLFVKKNGADLNCRADLYWVLSSNFCLAITVSARYEKKKKTQTTEGKCHRKIGLSPWHSLPISWCSTPNHFCFGHSHYCSSQWQPDCSHEFIPPIWFQGFTQDLP